MNKEYKDKLIDDYSQSADSFYPDTDVMGLMYVTKIMSEYAEKEAIAFAEWIADNSWQATGHGMFFNPYKVGWEAHPTSELYNLYKQTIKP